MNIPKRPETDFRFTSMIEMAVSIQQGSSLFRECDRGHNADRVRVFRSCGMSFSTHFKSMIVLLEKDLIMQNFKKAPRDTSIAVAMSFLMAVMFSASFVVVSLSSTI